MKDIAFAYIDYVSQKMNFKKMQSFKKCPGSDFKLISQKSKKLKPKDFSLAENIKITRMVKEQNLSLLLGEKYLVISSRACFFTKSTN